MHSWTGKILIVLRGSARDTKVFVKKEMLISLKIFQNINTRKNLPHRRPGPMSFLLFMGFMGLLVSFC